jgi:hypothetical protein
MHCLVFYSVANVSSFRNTLSHYVRAYGLPVLLVVGLAIWKAIPAPGWNTNAHLPDVVVTYVPAGKFILENGLTRFLADASSVRVPLLTSLWFALWGADADLVRTVNFALHGASIVLAGFVGLRLGGRMSMLAAAALWGFSPVVERYVNTALIEPAYWFWSWAWLAAATAYWRSGVKRWLLLAGVFGGLSISFRAMLLYPLLFTCFVAALVTWWVRRTRAHRELGKRIILSAGVSVVLPLFFMAVNAVAHGAFSLSTGSGAAVFLGLSPIYGGVDPPMVGFGYDVGGIAYGDHLTIEGDKRLRAAAKTIVEHRTLREWVRTLRHKVQLTLFLGPEERRFAPDLQRWRMALVVLAIVGFACNARRFSVAIVAVIAMLALLQTVPLLHNTRYAAGALEMFLTVGAALAIHRLLSFTYLSPALKRNTSNATFNWLSAAKHAGLVIFVGAMIAIGLRYMDKTYRPQITSYGSTLVIRYNPSLTKFFEETPRIEHVDHATVSAGQWVTGKESSFGANYRVGTNPPYRIVDGNAMWIFEFSAQGTHDGGSCREFEFTYLPTSGVIGTTVQSLRFFLPNNRKSHRVVMPAIESSPLELTSDGAFRVIAHCPVGSRFRLQNLTHAYSTLPAEARQRYHAKAEGALLKAKEIRP